MTFYETVNFDKSIKSITDGARRKCPWGAKEKVPYKNHCNAVDETFYDAINFAGSM